MLISIGPMQKRLICWAGVPRATGSRARYTVYITQYTVYRVQYTLYRVQYVGYKGIRAKGVKGNKGKGEKGNGKKGIMSRI